MRCSKCGSENPDGKRFCSDCGSAFAHRCPECGSENPAGKKFCGECGAALATAASTAEAAAATVSESSSTVEGERKTVTALFADIKGSTALMRDLDPEEARAIVDPVLQLMMAAVHRYGGYVAQSTGDGIFALFGAPVAHEDHPQRALYAALAMQEELRRYADRLRNEGRIPVEARVGVNTGEVVVRSITTGAGQTEYTPIGHTTNLASRMQTAAPVGSIAVSENTRKLCEGFFILKPLGATRVKGVSEPVNVYEVTGPGPLRTRLQRAVGRGLTKFVGREREMDALKHAAEQAKSGHGQIVAAMAEPGVGKSRLLFEFKAISQSGWMVLETSSVSHGKANAYLPVTDLLRNYFDISAGDDERKRREKVAGKITILDRSLEDTLPHLFSLLGIVEGDDPLAQMDGQIKKRRTLDAIKRILLRESLNQPLMVIFEDLHWIDEATQELLNLLADSIGTAKLLLLVNYRPEYSHQWGSKTYYTQLRLDPLGKGSADEMLSALLGEGKDLIPLKRVIIEKTEGNPFFMEETVQALFEDGVLQRNGTVKLGKSMNAVKVPATVQAVLTSRIDRLSAEEKELLQTLAVIGKAFPLNLVKHMTASQGDRLEPMLKDLLTREFIYEQPMLRETEYISKHALTQEVAYSSVLMERRRLLHERTGDAIEALFKDRIDDHLAELAHHYSSSANTRKAAEYLFRVGRQAAARSAHSEAVTRLSNALELLKQLPDDAERTRQELAVLSALGRSLLHAKGWAAAELGPVHARARELCAQIRDPVLAVRTLWLQWLFHYSTLELDKAMELAGELLAAAEDTKDPAMLLAGNTARGVILLFLGELVPANEHLKKALAVFDLRQPLSGELDAQRVGAFIHWYFVLYRLGYPDRAWEKSREMMEVTQRSSVPYVLALASCSVPEHHLLRGDSKTAQKCAEEAMALTEKMGLATLSAAATTNHGAALIAQGRYEEGIAEMRRGIFAIRASGGTPNPSLLCHLASGLGRIGRPQEGFQVLEKGFASVTETGAQLHSSRLHRVKGELLLVQNPLDVTQAERCFRTTVEIARRQSDRSEELRATTSLARLISKQGPRDEARAMLTEIYGWFTEGFDTADLKNARALLEELDQ